MDISQCVAYIQCYIHVRKGVEVDINPHSAMMRPDLLMAAYNAAERWFNSNNGTVEYLR